MVKTKLSVNINKIATLRNARGHNNPNVVAWAEKIESFGAEGITVHPRPDERHIKYQDVYELKNTVTTEFNIEGYPTDDFCRMVLEVKPTQVTLVPDEPGQLTSDHGWNTQKHLEFLINIITKFKDAGIRTSIFLDPDPELILSASKTGTDRIELYTESYAKAFGTLKEDEVLNQFANTAHLAKEHHLGINAGHDLDLLNLSKFNQAIPNLLEVSIGHALICDALEMGMPKTVEAYLKALE